MSDEKKVTLEDLVNRLDAITGVRALPYARTAQVPYAAECMWVGPPPTYKVFQFEMGKALPIVVKVEGNPMPSTVFAIFQSDTEFRIYTLGVPDKETKKVLPPMRISLTKNSYTCIQERFFDLDVFLAEIADEIMELNVATAVLNADDVLVSSELALDARAAAWARAHGYVDPEPDEEEEDEDEDEDDDPEVPGTPQ